MSQMGYITRFHSWLYSVISHLSQACPKAASVFLNISLHPFSPTSSFEGLGTSLSDFSLSTVTLSGFLGSFVGGFDGNLSHSLIF